MGMYTETAGTIISAGELCCAVAGERKPKRDLSKTGY